MKTVGIVRGVDDLGRVVIPKEMRNLLNIKCGDRVEMNVGEGGTIIIQKFPENNELMSSVFSLKSTVTSFKRCIPSNVYNQLMGMIEDAEKLVNDMGM